VIDEAFGMDQEEGLGAKGVVAADVDSDAGVVGVGVELSTTMKWLR
jgi:hypothetical protein